jgi:hypothetical protein
MRLPIRGFASTVCALSLCLSACGGGGATGTDPTQPTEGPGVRVLLTAEPENVSSGQTTRLIWDAMNATSCVASGAWEGERAVSGIETTAALAINTIFSIRCTGPDGNATSASTEIRIVEPPSAIAGPDRIVYAGAFVVMTGSASEDPNGYIGGYEWKQISGPEVALTNASSPQAAAFIAPIVAQPSTLTFELIAIRVGGARSTPDEVTITVLPMQEESVQLTGAVHYERVPVRAAGGLEYQNQIMEPSRAVLVEVLDASSQTLVTTAITDEAGVYSVQVPANSTLAMRVHARSMSSTAATSWSAAVRDVSAGEEPYVIEAPAVTVYEAPVIANISIASGWSSAGQLLGTRDAAAFAILDTAYRAYSQILAAAPNLVLEHLDFDWAVDHGALDAYYVRRTNTLLLSGEVDIDTDEYDAPLILHEFGHYLEEAIGRSDTLGGAHTSFDSLDPRNAFSEGFATAFAAMVLDDPNYYDSILEGQQGTMRYSVEDLTPENPGWYNEASVSAVLWDLFDDANEPHDPISLWIKPMLDALAAQRVSPALVSIFSFLTSLKEQNSEVAFGIEQIAAHQRINAVLIDPYGTHETNNHNSENVLPLYSPITIGGPAVTVRSTSEFSSGPSIGFSNALSVRRYLRLEVASPQRARVTVRGAGPDGREVINIYRQGVLIRSGITFISESMPVELEVPGVYILEVTDCYNNGNCSAPVGGVRAVDLAVSLAPM